MTQSKLIPLRYASLTFEFELVSSGYDAVFEAGDDTSSSANTDGLSITYVQVKASVCTLNNDFSNEIAEMLNVCGSRKN